MAFAPGEDVTNCCVEFEAVHGTLLESPNYNARMSLKSKIEAVIYASEEPVTLQQLVSLLAGEAQEELDDLAAQQAALPLESLKEQPGADATLSGTTVLDAGTHGDLEDAAPPSSTAQDEINDRMAADESVAATATNDAYTPSSPVAAAAREEPEDTDADPDGTGNGAQTESDKRQQREREKAVRDHLRRTVDTLIREYAESDRGIEIREVASGFRMGTKPEYHDAVRGFVKSLKPPLKLTLQALETLAVVAYKQPVTAAEISEIRGVDSAGVLGGLMTRKLIATAGRKQVIGRPMLYKTTRDFLLRFGLKDVNELPSMEEFERMAGELAEQEDLPMESADAIIENANARGDAEMLREANEDPVVDATDASNTNEEQEEATAEIAAGGNDEEATAGQTDQHPEQETQPAADSEEAEPGQHS